MRKFITITSAILLTVYLLNEPTSVSRVIDGDTIEVSSYRGTERIRLARINAPELGTPAGEEARLFLWKKIWGKRVFIKRIKKGFYNRTIAIVYVDGEDINQLMLDSGHAVLYGQAERQ